MITKDVGQASERFNDALTRLSNAFQGVFLKALEEVLPMLVEMAEKMVAWVKEGDNVKVAAERVAVGFKLVASAGIILKNIFSSIGTLFGYNVYRLRTGALRRGGDVPARPGECAPGPSRAGPPGRG